MERVDRPPAPERPAAFEARVDAGSRRRAEEPPPLRLERSDVLASEIRELRDALDDLRARASRAGRIDIRGTGWRGRIELSVKSFVRRLILRHLDQQREVDEAAIRVLERVLNLLERQNLLADANAAQISDFAVRHESRRS